MLKLFFSVFFIVAVFRSSAQSGFFAQRDNSAVQLSVNEATLPKKRALQSRDNRGFIRCLEDTDYNGILLGTVKVTEIRICHDLCAANLSCHTWSYSKLMTLDDEEWHDCYFRDALSSQRRPDLNTQSAQMICVGRAYRCFEKYFYETGGNKVTRTGVTLQQCYDLCLKSTDCEVFVYNVGEGVCIAAAQRIGNRLKRLGQSYVSGYPRCTLGRSDPRNSILTTSAPRGTTQAAEEDDNTTETMEDDACVQDTDWGGSVVDTMKVTEVEICREMCVSLLNCHVFVFSTTSDTQGLHDCSMKDFPDRDRTPATNLQSALLSCEGRNYNCFKKYFYGIHENKTTEQKPSVRSCYQSCVAKSECEIFVYNLRTKECSTASKWSGASRSNANYVTGFRRCGRIAATPRRDLPPFTPEETEVFLDKMWFPTS